MPDANEVHARVTKVLVQSLGVEEDDVIPSATLQGDLGAESIDFLDIMFRLEREFSIKIERNELFPEPISPDDPTFARDGRLTDQGLTAPVGDIDAGIAELRASCRTPRPKSTR